MQRAFSLVELSIVLVILGLITGGILAGQSLIRAAELRAVVSEHDRYYAAISTFRAKYASLPGDMHNAQQYWGAAASCPGSGSATTAASVPTCNGNGNGYIELDTTNSVNEIYRVWQHLANEGLIEGTYSGVNAAGDGNAMSTNDLVKVNVPGSRLAKAHWGIIYLGRHAINSGKYFDGDYGNSFYFNSGIANAQIATSATTDAVLRPEEAWNIDTKMDDGKPGLGNVLSLKTPSSANAASGCSDVDYTTAYSIASSSSYLLSNTTVTCTFVIKFRG
jgi:prepilin-type N-terminal cleavage/methylation domain-containing protein